MTETPTPRTPGEPVAWRWRWIGGDGRVKHWTVRQCEPTATWTGTEVQSLIPASDLSQAIKERDEAVRLGGEMADLLALSTNPDRFGEAGTGDVYLRMVAAERRFRAFLTTMEKRCG